MKHNRVLLGFLAAVAAMMFLFCGDSVVQIPAGSGGGTTPGGGSDGSGPTLQVTNVAEPTFEYNTSGVGETVVLRFTAPKAGTAYYVVRYGLQFNEPTEQAVLSSSKNFAVAANAETVFRVNLTDDDATVYLVVQDKQKNTSGVIPILVGDRPVKTGVWVSASATSYVIPSVGAAVTVDIVANKPVSIWTYVSTTSSATAAAIKGGTKVTTTPEQIKSVSVSGVTTGKYVLVLVEDEDGNVDVASVGPFSDPAPTPPAFSSATPSWGTPGTVNLTFTTSRAVRAWYYVLSGTNEPSVPTMKEYGTSEGTTAKTSFSLTVTGVGQNQWVWVYIEDATGLYTIEKFSPSSPYLTASAVTRGKNSASFTVSSPNGIVLYYIINNGTYPITGGKAVPDKADFRAANNTFDGTTFSIPSISRTYTNTIYFMGIDPTDAAVESNLLPVDVAAYGASPALSVPTKTWTRTDVDKITVSLTTALGAAASLGANESIDAWYKIGTLTGTPDDQNTQIYSTGIKITKGGAAAASLGLGTSTSNALTVETGDVVNIAVRYLDSDDGFFTFAGSPWKFTAPAEDDDDPVFSVSAARNTSTPAKASITVESDKSGTAYYYSSSDPYTAPTDVTDITTAGSGWAVLGSVVADVEKIFEDVLSGLVSTPVTVHVAVVTSAYENVVAGKFDVVDATVARYFPTVVGKGKSGLTDATHATVHFTVAGLSALGDDPVYLITSKGTAPTITDADYKTGLTAGTAVSDATSMWNTIEPTAYVDGTTLTASVEVTNENDIVYLMLSGADGTSEITPFTLPVDGYVAAQATPTVTFDRVNATTATFKFTSTQAGKLYYITKTAGAVTNVQNIKDAVSPAATTYDVVIGENSVTVSGLTVTDAPYLYFYINNLKNSTVTGDETYGQNTSFLGGADGSTGNQIPTTNASTITAATPVMTVRNGAENTATVTVTVGVKAKVYYSLTAPTAGTPNAQDFIDDDALGSEETVPSGANYVATIDFTSAQITAAAGTDKTLYYTVVPYRYSTGNDLDVASAGPAAGLATGITALITAPLAAPTISSAVLTTGPAGVGLTFDAALASLNVVHYAVTAGAVTTAPTAPTAYTTVTITAAGTTLLIPGSFTAGQKIWAYVRTDAGGVRNFSNISVGTAITE